MALDRLALARRALLSRRLEERIVALTKSGELPATLHEGAGQEVAQLAALAAFADDDPLLYAHRGIAYWLARDLPAVQILCDAGNREGGTNAGRGNLMHIVDHARGIVGQSGTLGGNLVVGAGVAAAEQRMGTGRVTVVFFGDGTSNRGQFHEAANYAGVAKLPIVFVCENNGWGLSVPSTTSTAVADIASRAAGYGFPGVVVDGHDVDDVYAAAAAAADRARAGDGPTLVEIKVDRLKAHFLGDQQRYRTTVHDLADPLDTLRADVVERGLVDDAGWDALDAAVVAEVDAAVAAFRSQPLASVGRAAADVLGAAPAAAPPPPLAAAGTRTVKYAHAIKEALHEALRDDERVVVFGEDVGPYGGVWGVLRGLHDEFGDRVFDTPISENLIVGMAVGMALRGMRPVAELQYGDFVFCAGDEVFLKCATWRYAHGGAHDLPLVVRMASGGSGFGPEHSQCTEAYLMHTPGVLVAVPSTPADAKGLMATALAGNDPVFFFEHKSLYGMAGPVPEGPYATPFGKAAVRRSGDACTIVAWQEMLRRALAAADVLAADGIEVEVIDPVTLSPFDLETLVESVRKTGACMVVEEAPRTLGVGAEIGAMLMESAFGYLDRPLVRLAIPDTPVPSAPHLAAALVPSVDDIVASVRELLR